MLDEKQDYGKTLNLPSTEFPMRGNLPENEPKTEQEVFENDLYEKMLKKNEGHKTYILHDGPPYANGEIHMGHALNKVLKDTVEIIKIGRQKKEGQSQEFENIQMPQKASKAHLF